MLPRNGAVCVGGGSVAGYRSEKRQDDRGSWWTGTTRVHVETNETAAAFLEGYDGSCHNGSQRRYLKKPRQQVPLSLKAELPKAAHLEAAWCAPTAACGHLPDTAPAAAPFPLQGRALRSAEIRRSRATMTGRCACAAEAADHVSQERRRVRPRPVHQSPFQARR